MDVRIATEDRLDEFLALDGSPADELATRPPAGGRRRLFLIPGRARVAALLDERLLDANGQPIGQVGRFVAADEPSARSVLDRAVDWLAGEGARRIWGPMTGGAHRPHRLMTEGFETDPFLGEPRNPPEDPDRLASAGFRPILGWGSHEFTIDAFEVAIDQAVGDGPSIRRARRRFRIEFPDPADAPTTLARLHRLLDEVWSGHPGYVPFALEEFSAAFAGPLSLTPPEHLLVAVDEDGRDVGFGWFYPDLLGGVDRAVWHTIAVAPRVRRTGVSSLLLEVALGRTRAAGYARIVVALVIETYPLFENLVAASRRYALYERTP